MSRPQPFIRSRATAAFTLLEVMIAIAILTVVVGAIYGTWRAILGGTRVAQVVASEVQQERVALRCIEQSLTYAVRYEANQRFYYFVTPNDEANVLSFVSRLPESFPRSGRFGNAPIRRVEFSLQRGKEGLNDLVLRQQMLLAEEFDIDEREHPLVLMSGVREMNLEYWDIQQQDWTTEWTTTNLIPPKVRIILTLQGKQSGFDQGREIVREIVPASVGVQAVWQGRGAGGQPARAPGAPGAPVPNPQPPVVQP